MHFPFRFRRRAGQPFRSDVFLRTALLCSLLLPVGTAAGQRASVQNSSKTGTLRVRLTEGPALIYEDGVWESAVPFDSTTELSLSAGWHMLTIATPYAIDTQIHYYIKRDSTTFLNVQISPTTNDELYLRRSTYHPVLTGRNLIVMTDDDAEVYVNGVTQGRGIMRLAQEPGRYRIEARRSDGASRSTTIVIPPFPAGTRVAQLYTRPDRRTTRSLAVVPGATQLHRRQYLRGVAFLTGGIAATYWTVHQHRVYTNAAVTYRLLEAEYRNAFNETAATNIGDYLEALAPEVRAQKRRRNVAAGTLAAVFTANVLDALWPPAAGYRKTPGSVRDLAVEVAPDAIGIKVTLGLGQTP